MSNRKVGAEDAPDDAAGLTSDPRRIEIALVRAARSVRRAFNLRLSEIDLNMTEAGLLSFLDEHGSLNQRELADLLHITRVSAGTCIDSLEKRGLVKRTGDPVDRRVWLIGLTEQGMSIVEEFKRIDAQVRKELRKGFDRSERQQLADLLRRVTTAADAASEAVSLVEGGSQSMMRKARKT